MVMWHRQTRDTENLNDPFSFSGVALYTISHILYEIDTRYVYGFASIDQGKRNVRGIGGRDAKKKFIFVSNRTSINK